MNRPTRAVILAIQWLFLIAVAAALVVAWRDQGEAVSAVLSRADPVASAVALASAVAAMLALVPHWRATARVLGADVSATDSAAIVIAGQLGKYIPGGVWTIGAQGYSAHRARLDWRLGVAAGFLQLATLLACGLGIGGVLVAAGATPVAPLWGVIGITISVAAFLPPVLRASGRVLRSPAVTVDAGGASALILTSLSFWAATIVMASAAAIALTIDDVAVVIAASALAYVAGALVVIAPAGIGVREAVILGVVGPSTGVATAAALALLLRLSAVVGDLLGAVILASLRRRRLRPPAPRALD
jgi:uncharacterized membrane protein YbhN (UPF0104 family)